jgi:hypothetical protein
MLLQIVVIGNARGLKVIEQLDDARGRQRRPVDRLRSSAGLLTSRTIGQF